jgi:transposase
MSEYIEGSSRQQVILLPDRLDDYVGDENEVRFIDAFVDTLDLVRLGFTHSEPKDEGRPPYDPKDMLKLYVWGYMNQVRSSRKLERECHRNLELLWLMKRLAPDFWTISEFRKQNVERIKGVFREFVAFLQDIDLVEGKLASIDGSKFKAVNAKKRYFTKESLETRLRLIDERVERYLKEIERNDGGLAGKGDDEGGDDAELLAKRNEYLRAKLVKNKKKREELEEIQRRLARSGQDEISLTDPESRMMKNNGKTELCYNSELSIDAKNKIIVDYDVTDEQNDERQLAPMSKSTKEALGVDRLDVTADSGFASAVQIKECVDSGITPYLPTGKVDGSNFGAGVRVPDPASFGKDRFAYDGEKDVYVCPAGKELTFRYATTGHGGKVSRLYRTGACKTCPFRERCTSNRNGRTIERWEHQEVIDELIRRVRAEPEKLETRAKLAEHPFGTMKRAFNQGYFLLKGLRKVKGEMGFTALAYDIRRALNILGTRAMLALVRT